MENIRSNVWEGVYKSIEEMPPLSRASEYPKWEDMLFEATRDWCRFYNKYSYLEDIAGCLAPLLFSYYAQYRKKIRLLDIGGAMGVHHIYLKTLKLHKLIDEHNIIEITEVCEKAKELAYTPENMKYYDGFPDTIKPFDVDVAYLNSVLQYIIPYQIAMSKLAEFNPTLICVERSYMGDFDTYYTEQCNVDPHIIAQMINKKDFISCLDRLGYEILIEEKKEWSADWYVDNLPEEFRPGGDYSSYIFINKNRTVEEKAAFIKDYAAYKRSGILSLLDFKEN